MNQLLIAYISRVKDTRGYMEVIIVAVVYLRVTKAPKEDVNCYQSYGQELLMWKLKI